MLAEARPDIAAEWHPDNALAPETVRAGSARRVRWRCSVCATEWEAIVSNRTYLGSGCPVCTARKHAEVKPGSSLLDRAPWAATEFDIEANGMHPAQVRGTSTMLAWWECFDCGYRWQAQVANRVKRRGICPKCAARSQVGRRKRPRG